MRDLARVTVLAGLLGQVAAMYAGVLPLALLGPAMVAFCLAAAASVGFGSRPRADRVLSLVGSGLAVGLFLLTLPRLSVDRDGLRESLGLLLVGIQVAHALTWRARRDLQTALFVSVGLLVLGASFAPDVVAGLWLVAGWAAVVAGFVLAAGLRTFEGVSSVGSGGRRPPVLPATALALVLGLAAFLLVPVDSVPNDRNPLAALTGAASDALSRGTAAYSSSRMDMRVRGTLSDRPVLEVPTDSPTLWRSTIYPYYDGTRWSTGGPRLEGVPGPPYVVGASFHPARTDAVRLRGRADGTVWSPGEPVTVDALDGSAIRSDGEGTVRSRGAVRDYRITSGVPTADPDLLRAAGSARLGDTFGLPDRLPVRVRALASSLIDGAPSTYDAVLAVETWLRTHATYRLDSPVPSRGEDAVDRFLFVDRTGFCEQFAAAETVLLRSAGISARLVTGLAYGEDIGGGRRLYREKNLHAWVEVLYPGVGWVASDPTAGAALAGAAGGASIRQRTANAVDGALQRAESVPGGRRTLAVVLLLGALATAIVVLLARRRPKRSASSEAPADPVPAGPALAAFLRYDERLGPRRRRPSESLAELAARLGPEPAAALEVVEQECYARVPPAGAGQAAALLDRLELTPS